MALLSGPKGLITFQELATEMKIAVREEAEADPRFIHGAMRFLFCPKTEHARKFLGGFDEEFVNIEVAAPIVKGGDMFLPPNYYGRGGDGCDCYGYAGLKIEGCSYAVKNGLGRRSSDTPEAAVVLGRIRSRGCVAFDIDSSLGVGDEVIQRPWMRVYSSVSGGNGGAFDEACALGVRVVLWKMVSSMRVSNQDQYVLISPEMIGGER